MIIGVVIIRNGYLSRMKRDFGSLTPQNATTKALDLPGCNTTNGIQLNIWDTFNNDCQKFQLVDMGDNYYQVRVKDGSKCLDVDGWSTDNLAKIVLWDCHDGANQQWRLLDGGLKRSLSIDKEHEDSNLQINAYPNPVKQNLNIGVNNYNGEIVVRIYGVDGQLDKQIRCMVESKGEIVIPQWGYRGDGYCRSSCRTREKNI